MIYDISKDISDNIHTPGYVFDESHIDDLILSIKNQRAFKAALEEEINNLKAKIINCELYTEKCSAAVQAVLNGEKSYKNQERGIHAYQRFTESVDVLNMELLPEDCKSTKTTITPSKKIIKEKINSGTSVPGATIKKSVSLVVK